MTASFTRNKVGIIFALPIEKSGFENVLAESHTFAFKSKDHETWYIGNIAVMISISGIGREQSARATEALIGNGAQSIISSGFSAALAPGAKHGDVIVADKVLLRENPNAPIFKSDPRILKAMPPSGTLGFAIHQCDLMTSDSIVASSAEKQQIYENTLVGALDMEAYAAAEVCAREGVPFATIRGISDLAEENIAYELDELLKLNGTLNLLLYILARPNLWPQLIALKRNASIASKHLGDVLGLLLLRFM